MPNELGSASSQKSSSRSATTVPADLRGTCATCQRVVSLKPRHTVLNRINRQPGSGIPIGIVSGSTRRVPAGAKYIL